MHRRDFDVRKLETELKRIQKGLDKTFNTNLLT